MTTLPTTSRPPDRPTRRFAVDSAAILDRTAGVVLRYGLVAVLVAFGAFKFHPAEARAIEPLVANSPLFSWLYSVLSVQGASNLIGASELAIAALLAAKPVAPKPAVLGGAGAVGMFLSTLSFLATTPGAWVAVPGWPTPVPTADGGFLLKDVLLLGAALWCTADAVRAARPAAA